MTEEKPEHPGGTTSALSTDALLAEVYRLALELHPQHAKSLRVTLDSTLDRELGLDSLSRVELSLRLERTFGVGIPEQALASAETVRELWQALSSADVSLREPPSAAEPVAAGLDRLTQIPDSVLTLLEMLDWHVQQHPQRPHVHLYADAQEPELITYADLADGAGAMAAGLQEMGVLPGQTVAIMLPTSRHYLFSFFAILLAGAVPVPIYPPLRPSQLEDHLRRHAGILANAESVLLITLEKAQGVARLLKSQVDSLREVVTPGELLAHRGGFVRPVVRSEDIAFLQYTSGSTGAPKGVILTHADLLANIRAMGAAVRADSTDVFVSWLPLYHDMGLIGAWLGSLYFGMPLVLMSPLAFLSQPRRWLWTIHRHAGTLTAAPNFAYELCLSKLHDRDLEGLNLGSLRLAFNGAEPVSPNTVRRFSERFAAYGLRKQALAPVYGLAEAAVGLAFPPPERGFLIDRIRRDTFAASGEAAPAADSDPDFLEFVACGQPLPGYQVRIIDAAGRELPERHEGRLQFQGPSATRGYLNNEQATRNLIDGVWRDSGDRAYVAGGDVYLTGRVKDLIIRGGRNIYPYEVEEAVGDIAGVRKGCVAVFGSIDPVAGTERVIVVAETREAEQTAREALQLKVAGVAADLLGGQPDEVLLAPPHTVLKTSSGKIRRAAVRDLFEAGRIGQASRGVWWQVVRLAARSLRPRLRSLRRRSSQTGYAVYAHLVFWSLAPITWLLIAVLPRERWRWSLMRSAARLLFRLAGVPLRVSGMDNWPKDRACVIVANHASYLDGVVLVATLPGPFSFVAKRELAGQLVPRVFLGRIGTVFVERFEFRRGLRDAQQTVDTVKAGRALMFFPEGTFTRIPGLRYFHMGAFVAAAEAGVPMVPVSLQGTRSILRDRSRFPRRGEVQITVGSPVMATGADWAAAVKLRDISRTVLLEHLHEPDLAQQRRQD